MADEFVDVLIMGAGLSGIGAACHLQRECPDRRFAILEGRQALGGTWDLFRYPGIRSDSDMYTLGYDFKPWTGAKAIADGPSILAYLRETVAENDLRRHMRFGHRVVAAAWSTADAQWAVTAQRDAKTTIMTDDILARWSSPAAVAKELRHRLVALDIWKAWADGQNVSDEQLGVAVATFGGTKDDRMNALSQVTLQWARSVGVDLHPVQPTLHVRDRALPELGL